VQRYVSVVITNQNYGSESFSHSTSQETFTVYGTRRFIILFTRALALGLSYSDCSFLQFVVINLKIGHE
jgi:hypothetical protein